MKKFLYLLALACIISLSASMANAQRLITGSAVYGVSKTMRNNPKGFVFKYRYEYDDIFKPISFIGALLYTETDKFENKVSYLKSQYMDISVGPVYRLNNMVSVYGTMGFISNKLQSKSINKTKKDLVFLDYGISFTAGIQIDPLENFVIDFGYETGILHDDRVKNIFAGVGCSF
ncbi:Ail/Lom family outer membrane beta-barrel protein [Candidatus Pantoea edessiphila]|nr:Ail/Lom family outer membrane beta-barrel protein [Candidatus Pantoea edessiphila]